MAMGREPFRPDDGGSEYTPLCVCFTLSAISSTCHVPIYFISFPLFLFIFIFHTDVAVIVFMHASQCVSAFSTRSDCHFYSIQLSFLFTVLPSRPFPPFQFTCLHLTTDTWTRGAIKYTPSVFAAGVAQLPGARSKKNSNGSSNSNSNTSSGSNNYSRSDSRSDISSSDSSNDNNAASGLLLMAGGFARGGERLTSIVYGSEDGGGARSLSLLLSLYISVFLFFFLFACLCLLCLLCLLCVSFSHPSSHENTTHEHTTQSTEYNAPPHPVLSSLQCPGLCSLSTQHSAK